MNSFFTYDISDDEVVELGPTSEIGSTANCVRISPEIFSFIHAKEIRDLNPETREYDFTMNILSPDASIKNMMYNAPITQKYETRSNHYSSIWKNYTVYPGGDDPDNWYVNLYDAKNKTEYRITEKPGVHHYPTINEGIITYFLERPTGDGYDLVIHRIEELEPAGEQGDVNRELEFEEGVVCVDSKNIWSLEKVTDKYIVWIESIESDMILKSYSFETGVKKKLLEYTRPRVHFQRQKIMYSDDCFAIEEEFVDKLGTKVSIGKLDGTDLFQVKDDKVLSVSLLAMKNDKVYIYNEYPGEKFDGVFEYDITSGKTEFLFDPSQKIREFHLVGDYFVTTEMFQDIRIYDRKGKILRTLTEKERNENPDYNSFNSINMIIDEYIIFNTHKSRFSFTDDYYFYDRDFCYNINTGGLWHIPDVRMMNTRYASYKNSDIFLFLEWENNEETKEFTRRTKSFNPKTRDISQITEKTSDKKYFIYNYGVTVSQSMVAYLEVIPDKDEKELTTRHIILFDVVSEKEYQVTEIPGNFSNLCLSKDRISYLEDNQIISHKIVKVEDSQ
ncbi:MAG: hypothetical protein KAH30_07240 [Caldisericia bacterium]|nr:hypothetical protein [Caldisericia bacterium]